MVWIVTTDITQIATVWYSPVVYGRTTLAADATLVSAALAVRHSSADLTAFVTATSDAAIVARAEVDLATTVVVVADAGATTNTAELTTSVILMAAGTSISRASIGMVATATLSARWRPPPTSIFAELYVTAKLKAQAKGTLPISALYIPTPIETTRIIVQEILSRKFLDWDLPVSNIEYERQICGPCSITGLISPELPGLAAMGIDYGAVWIHLEEAGRIMASGILKPADIGDSDFAIQAEGFSGYAHEIPYRDTWQLGNPVGADIDPLDVVREGWRHIQSYPDGNLGVVVDALHSPVRIGEVEKEVEFVTGEGEEVQFVAGPYRWNYWDKLLIGEEIDKLATETPFEYREQDVWNANKTDIIHRLELGYPRLGRRRNDLNFEQGRNIISLLPYAEDQDYASEVIVSGRGEGMEQTNGNAFAKRGKRIRRVKLIDDQTVASNSRAKAMAEDVIGKLAPYHEIKEITVLMHTDDAPYGSYDVGDDILVKGEVPYFGDLSLWHRIISYKPTHNDGTITLGLIRSERFTAGAMGRQAMAEQLESGDWILPDSVQKPVPKPKIRDENGDWVPV